MSIENEQILVTGATGRIAQALRPALVARYGAARLFARSPVTPLRDGETVSFGRLEDFGAVVQACTGVKTVIHLGGISDETTWEQIVEANIVGTYNVFEAARRCEVRRVIYASTHHVTGFYSTGTVVDGTTAPRPDTLYAVSKVFGESLARLYHDKWGMQAICLRIGACRDEPEYPDQLRTWLSTADCVRLLLAALDAKLPDGFGIAYGVSQNSRSFWDVTSALDLGFVPHDSADRYEGRLAGDDTSGWQWQGGAYTDPNYHGR